MITPRTTRLIRVPDLRAFRDTLAAAATDGSPFDVRDRLVIVPTRAAAAQLVRSIENRLIGGRAATTLPAFVPPGELTQTLAERLPSARVRLTDAEREALLGVACREANAGGDEAPFRLRAGLVAEVLAFYDTLRRNGKDVGTFERLALGALEPGAALDRGAARLVRQTRFLVSAFRHFEQLCAATGCTDEHVLRDEVTARAAERPWRHAVVAVGDRSQDPYGLMPVHWDLLARVPGLQKVDVVATERTLAGAFHERLHSVLPGIEEVRVEAVQSRPILLVPPDGGTHFARDREEEVAGFARWVKQSVRERSESRLDRTALVVRRPLPYIYVAREVLRSAGIPCQTFDALPLAAEPYAAALDLLFSFVAANFARRPAIALLRSPHFRFDGLEAEAVAALDRGLSEAGYLGDVESLSRIVASWRQRPEHAGLAAAGAALEALARDLLPLRSPAAMADHLAHVLTWLEGHEQPAIADESLRPRQLRARAAVLATLTSLRDAYRRFDPAPVAFDTVVATVRRWIDGQTFAPRAGESGVHLVDAESARFGDFDDVQLAGVVEGEWPERPRRNIFFSPAILRDLGWTAESQRIDGARAAFADLLTLPASRLLVSAFTLEDDGIVAPATVLDEVTAAGLEAREWTPDGTVIFPDDLVGREPAAAAAGREPGRIDGHEAAAFSLSALERYQDCPFRFFAADVLRLAEIPDDEPALSPRARGRFVHEVFERFFAAWDAAGGGTITSDRIDDARALFAEVAEPLLAKLPLADAELERARLFGSAIAVGIVDIVLGLEASRPAAVRERWLERRFSGSFALGAGDGRRVALKGVADRIDLLEGNRLRVIDYKSGYPPRVQRALQVPIYAACAAEMLTARDGGAWTIDEAAYVAFSGRRALVPVIKAGGRDGATVLEAARERVFAAVDGITGGFFPPRPHDPVICGTCPYPSVCRKDYAADK